MGRWAIYIDIEGFSALWDQENQVLWSLGELIRATFRIGREVFPQEPDRIFAHQIGDGFLILSDFHEDSLERAVTIAVALMRHVAASGRLAKTAMAEGDMSDIIGCYPREVLDAQEADLQVSLHMGLMTLFPVMGSALIKAVAVSKVSPRGPLVVVPREMAARMGGNTPVSDLPGTDLASVDWVHMDSPLLSDIQRRAALKSPTPVALENMLKGYCTTQKLPKEWVANVRDLLHASGAVSA